MKAHRIIPIVLLLLLSASVVAAATTVTKRRARPARTNPEDASQRIDINNISMVVKNTGSFAYDTENGSSGLEFPKGTGKTAVFAAGLWMGAQVGGNVRVSVAEYSDDYRPGAAPGGVAEDPSNPQLKVYKLNRVYLDANGNIDTATRDAVLADYTAGAVSRGAPAVSVQSDGSLNILGDQMLWSVYNDCGKGADHNKASTARPLGVEIQQTTFAFSRQGPLGNTVFMKYKIINRQGNTISNAYVSQWADPDLGGFTDDLVGCDTVLSVGYVYNATNNDEQYGGTPPCVGFDFLQGPLVGGNPLGLASFNKYPNGGGPQDSVETYNYMQGLNGDGSQLINPTNNLPTRFNVSGDPVTNTGWLDSSPSDRRLMLSSGPFTMSSAGDVQEVVVGLVVAQGSSRLASVALMKCYDAAVQSAYDANFNLASPPNGPVAQITPRDGEVFIRWDTGSENYNQPPYVWEGYNVYQGASVAGPWTRIATYDKNDGIQTVLDIECDPTSPVPLEKVKAFGTDAGVKYSIEVNQDHVRGGPLNSASAYFYAVTAYSVGIGQFQQVLESPFVPIRVVPQTPPAGVDLSTTSVSAVDHTQDLSAPPATPMGTDVVTVEVFDPAAMLNANYQVGFKPAGGTNTVWFVTRTVGAVTDTVVNNWTNVSGDDTYPVFDGIQVKLVSYPLGELARVTYEPAANPPLDGFSGAGLRFFNGGADYAEPLFGSSIPAFTQGTNNVELRFTGGPDGQYAYRYVRELDGGGNRVYFIHDYVPVPFTVWDTDANVQLNAAFLENAGPPAAPNQNGKWDPDNSGTGGREIVWVLDKPYFGDNTPDNTYFTDPNLQDVLAGGLDARYAVWPVATSAGAAPANGDKLLFTTSIPSNRYDRYSFSTTAADPFNTTLAKGEMSRIRAVPNPYFAHSTYETNRFNRVLKFTHLPARCTIRLFNLAGDLVRTIEKNDNTSQLTWDLNTDRGLPIGSGIYIFHVDAPGVGTTTGKVAVFMEKERLNNF